MNIRKKYKFEAAHRVMDCPSMRCSQNIHGHSFIVEVIFHSNFLDDGDMVIDFGLLKNTVGEFIDWFDHSMLVWMHDDEVMGVANSVNSRIVYTPMNTTAENLSKLFFMGINNILNQMIFNNGETGVSVQSVRVHETATGYAECAYGDIQKEDWKKLSLLAFSHIDPKTELLQAINLNATLDNPKEV